MSGNIVIAIIVIVLLLVLAIIGYLIYRLQSGFSRGRGGGSETSEGEA
jgi:flagellar basal body-associated protein FliL